jgi:hypothetical protein
LADWNAQKTLPLATHSHPPNPNGWSFDREDLGNVQGNFFKKERRKSGAGAGGAYAYAVRTLREAAKARKWRYVLCVLAKRLFEDPSGEELELFREAVLALRQTDGGRHLRQALEILVRYGRCLLRRDRAGLGRRAIEWLRLYPRSAVALRHLMLLTRKSPHSQPLFLSAALLLPIKKIRRGERTELCRKFLLAGRGEEAAEMARHILELQPDSAEARHLLWSALLQKTKKGTTAVENRRF